MKKTILAIIVPFILAVVFVVMAIGVQNASGSLNVQASSNSTYPISVHDTVQFNVTVTGGVPPYSYQWYCNATPVDGANSTTWFFVPTSNGTYSITLSINDSAGAQFNQGPIIPIVVTVGTPAPSPSLPPTPITVSLSESASSLNYGNKVNFTVTVDGGVPPYTYAWYMDNQLAETSNSQYFSTNSQAVGSHHVYVQVTDANNNSATTLAVEFNVLSGSSSSPGTSLPSSSTQQPTLQPTHFETPLEVPTPPPRVGDGDPALFLGIIAVVIAAIAVLGLAVYFTKFRKKKEAS